MQRICRTQRLDHSERVSGKGVSGFKVSASDRDAIQDLKAAAEKKEFDVLLVFMFDRIGRIDDETSFVVEWFIKHGIEVWSVNEGEQRMDNHVDKLMNYIRFWQANGESQKTSARVKTRLNQMTLDGKFTGGVAPFGYKLIKSGEVNKKGKELMDIVIDDDEAPIVKKIFEMTVKEGYGSYRMADYLNSHGVRTHNNSKFQCNTVNRILKNKIYCGYFISGGVESPYIERLHIIDENVYEQAQFILSQRSNKMKRRNKLQELRKAVHYFLEISIALIAVKRWHQQVTLINMIEQMAVSIRFAGRDTFAQIKQ